MTIRISHGLFNGLQKVPGMHGGSAGEGLSVVGLDLVGTPSPGYETSEDGKKFLSR